MTNREWLNSLSDEEMAMILSDMSCCDFCVIRPKDKCNSCRCVKGIVQWLNEKHIEPMPEINIGDFIKVKTKEYGHMILFCVKEKEGKTLFSVDKDKCFSLSAFIGHREIKGVYRYDSEKHCMKEIWRADNDK